MKFVKSDVKDNINENMSETLTMLSNIAFNYLKEKIKDIPQGIERILSSDEAQKEILEEIRNFMLDEDSEA